MEENGALDGSTYLGLKQVASSLYKYRKQYICKSWKYLNKPNATHYLEQRLIKLVPSTFYK